MSFTIEVKSTREMSAKLSKIYRGSQSRKSSGSSFLSKTKGNSSKQQPVKAKSDSKSETSVENSNFFVTNTEEVQGFTNNSRVLY